MKILLLFISCLFLFGFDSSMDTNKKRKLKQVTTYRIMYDNQSSKAEKIPLRIVDSCMFNKKNFNKNGIELEVLFADELQVHDTKRNNDTTRYFYNDKGLLIKELKYTQPYQGANFCTLTSEIEYLRNENDSVMEIIRQFHFSNPNPLAHTREKFIYEGNKRICWEIYQADSVIFYRCKYQYNQKSNLFVRENFNLTYSSKSYFDTLYYNDKGYLIKVTTNIHSVFPTNYQKETIYKYDDKGNMIQEIFGPDKINSYKYDDRNNKIEFKYSSGKWTYQYDKYGNIIERKRYNEQNLLVEKFIYINEYF